MSEFEELFGDWAVDGSGEPTSVVVSPVTGQGAWGPTQGEPVTVTCPTFYGSRLIRAADNNEVVVSVTLYPSTADTDHFTLNGEVLLADGRTSRVVRIDRPSIEGLFDFGVVYLE